MGATTSQHVDDLDSDTLTLTNNESLNAMRTNTRKICEACGGGFSCCGTKYFCMKCGKLLCKMCKHEKKILTHGRPRMVCCIPCSHPSKLVRIVRTEPRVWSEIMLFFNKREINTVLQTCRLFQISMPLPFRCIDRWEDVFDAPTFLAAGAYGSVNKAHCKELSQVVAVKMLKKRQIFSARKWATIVREIDIHASMSHDNAIRLIGPKVLQTRHEVFIVMELADEDLFDRIVNHGPMAEDPAMHIARQLLSFLANIHAKGIVHRDIKPENLLLSYKNGEPQLKVADFGFARIFNIGLLAGGGAPTGPASATSGAHSAGERTVLNASQLHNRDYGTSVSIARNVAIGDTLLSSAQGAMAAHKASMVHLTPCGTYGFAAPELLDTNNRGGEDNTKALLKEASLFGLDVFAAGVVIHILLTGCEPFPCKSTSAHLRAVKRGLRRDHALYQNISKDAMDLMSLMLCYESSSRPNAAAILRHQWFTPRVPYLRQPSESSYEDTSLSKHQSARAAKGFLTTLQDRGRNSNPNLPSLTVSEAGHIVLYDAPDFQLESDAYTNNTPTKWVTDVGILSDQPTASAAAAFGVAVGDDALSASANVPSYPAFGITEHFDDEPDVDDSVDLRMSGVSET